MKIQLIILVILLVACGPGNHVSSSQDATPMTSANSVFPNNAALSLADYLKRLPGVQVQQQNGNTIVMVRGNTTMEGQREPLFIINGVNVGNGYEHAEPLVAVTDIASVQVLKSGQETAPYGIQGNGGVIVIKTKK